MHYAKPQRPLRHQLLGFYHALANSALDPLRCNKNIDVVPPLWGQSSHGTLADRMKVHGPVIEDFLENHKILCNYLLDIEETVRCGNIPLCKSTIKRFIATHNTFIDDIRLFRESNPNSFLHYPSVEYVVDGLPVTFNPQHSLPGITSEVRRLETKISKLHKEEDLDFLFISPHTRYSGSDNFVRSGNDLSYLGKIELTRYWWDKLAVQTTSK